MSLQMIDIDERNIQCCRKTFGKRSSDEQRPHKSGASCERHRTQILRVTPARFKASDTTGIIFCWCARDANSGTTPP